MSNYKFCPDCSRFLYPTEKIPDEEDSDVEEKGLYLECDECGYYEKIKTFSTTHFSKKTKEIKYINKARMVKDYLYDFRFKRTTKMECINSNCSSRNENNPEIVLITNNKQPEIAYLCGKCNHIWGKF